MRNETFVPWLQLTRAADAIPDASHRRIKGWHQVKRLFDLKTLLLHSSPLVFR